MTKAQIMVQRPDQIKKEGRKLTCFRPLFKMEEERSRKVRLPHRGLQEGTQAIKSNLSMHAGSCKDLVSTSSQPTQTRARASVGKGFSGSFLRTKSIWASGHWYMCASSCAHRQALGSLKTYREGAESLIPKLATDATWKDLKYKYSLNNNGNMHSSAHSKYESEIEISSRLLGQKAL